ncbi:MAG: methyltransferase domain-containing protein [Pyrinomonadaceae bacterium]
MRFYRVSEDWITHLDGDFRAAILTTLRELGLVRLQKYPPPKINGLPLGNEPRVFSRFLKGHSSQLDASVFSSVYRSGLSAAEKLLYRAFRQNEALSIDTWNSIIGVETVAAWIKYKCLRENGHGLMCQFSVVALDGLVFAVDPLKDHGETWEPDFIVDDDISTDPDIEPFFHTYIGQDSLQMIEAMEQLIPSSGGRYLDCGPGSGGVLLYFSRRFIEAVGIDINARAAKLAQFNADLNQLTSCRTFRDDALNLEGRYGKFDVVSWNLPFIFMPAENEDDFIDGFGGELGIGLCLRFIETVHGLLNDHGTACVAAMAPILISGENVLETKLGELLDGLGLDCRIQVAQVSLAHNRELWQFHRASGVRKFESVYLYLTKGSGKITRLETTAARKVLDAVREKMYERKFG